MVAIDAPELAPVARPDLLATANVVDNAVGYALQNALSYEPRFTDGTLRPVPTDGSAKVFDKRGADNETETFTVYRGLDLPLLRGIDAGKVELEAIFAAGESLYVEAEVQKRLLNPAAVDITPGGTAVKYGPGALGLLDQWIAPRFLARPTISGDLLATTLVQPGSPYVTATPAGTPIAMAAGYSKTGPGGKVAGATEAWLYVSGQINVWTAPAQIQGGPDLKKNRDLTLAEKSYAVSIDGPVAAILVGF